MDIISAHSQPHLFDNQNQKNRISIHSSIHSFMYGEYLKAFVCLCSYRWLLSWPRRRPPSMCSCTPWETRTTAGASGSSSPGRRSCPKKCLRLRTSPNKNSSSTLTALVISLWKVLLIGLFVCLEVVRARGCCVCVQWFSGVCVMDLLLLTTAVAPCNVKGPLFRLFSGAPSWTVCQTSGWTLPLVI